MNQQRNQHDRPKQRAGENNVDGRSIAEWTTLGISIAIVAAILGLITFLYYRGTEEAPRIEASANLEGLRHEQSGYYLPVEVTNEGDQTVEDVIVEAELDTGEGQPQTAEITVMFLAGGERATGTFVFEDDPSQGDLTVHATSYKNP
jgi:uncharacterized protein (TIGR02588 family)